MSLRNPSAVLCALCVLCGRSGVVVLSALLASASGAAERPEAVRARKLDPDYGFDGRISRPVLEKYLSRSITMMDLLTGRGSVDDNIRMLTGTGVKFAGRTLYRWGNEGRLSGLLPKAKRIARRIHAIDPQMILQAGVFECVTTDAGRLTVPGWVFEEFGLAPEKRTFRYEKIIFPDGRWRNRWMNGWSVPDIRQLETKMWFFYLAAEYIKAGCEAIHFGQVALIGARDQGMKHWWDMLSRVRRYAAAHARRRMVILDAHVPTGGRHHGRDKLLFDFHSFPLRIDEVPDRPGEGVLRVGYLDSIYGRSKGGVTPSGWRCEHLPYLVELDNWGASGKGGRNIGGGWTWGYDEICWFAHQSEEYRNRWLGYAWKWVREHDPNGFLQMPGSRCLASPVADDATGRKIRWYFANSPSPAVPNGFNQEGTIKAIWAEDTRARRRPDAPTGRNSSGTVGE